MGASDVGAGDVAHGGNDVVHMSATCGRSLPLHEREFYPLLPPVCTVERSRRPESDSAAVSMEGVCAHDWMAGEVRVGVVTHDRAASPEEVRMAARDHATGTVEAGV